MNKEDRSVYIALGQEVNASLCTFCRYGEWQREGCCEGHNECQHPLDRLAWEQVNGEPLEPGGDCYGFNSGLGVSLAADLVGAIISQGYDEWFYRRFSPRSVTVYGRSFQESGETSGKVRIG